jgi:hypothetical protein
MTFLLALLVGCGGATALELHAKAALVTKVALDAGGEAIVVAREASLMAAAASGGELETRARVASLRESWAVVIEAHELARVAFIAWVDLLAIAAYEQKYNWEAVLRLLRIATEAYGRVRVLASALGLELEPLPGVLL